MLAESPAAAGELLEALAEVGGFDRAALEALPAGSPLLAATVPGALRGELRAQDVCPVLPLNGPGPDLGGRISHKLLADVAWRRRRLERSSRVQLRRAGAHDLPARLADLFRLHRARWGARGQQGVLAAQALERFHAEAAPALLRAGLLRLLSVHVGGRAVAVLHALAAQGRAYAYLSGLDPAWAQASPGSMLFLRLIEDAREEGLQELDFLRGQEAYKYRFGPEDRHTLTLELRPVAGAEAQEGR
ncbi:MAG: GNAT family N-acetyltransferase [Anaeromyxobacter sp.]